jgi:hypothetical protein
MTSHFLAILVRPANRGITRGGDGSLPECWLLAEWPSAADKPTGFWLYTLPEFTPAPSSCALSKIRWRIERDDGEPKQGLG